MKGWIIPQFGLEHLTLQELSPEALGPQQVRLRIRAVSLNYRDILTVLGQYNPKQPLPLTPCSDASAEVVEIGSDVDRVKVGDRVCPIFAQEWHSGELTRAKGRSTLGGPLPGTLRQEAVLHQQGLVKFPDHLTWEEAACLPCAGVTAWNALFCRPLTPGQTVLTLGTGGVSIFALQFARLAGLKVAITSSSDDKLDRARHLGAECTVNYRLQPQWFRPILEWSGGVDSVIEVGGASTLPMSLRCLRMGGHISMIGVLGGHEQPLDVRPILMNQLSIQGILVGHRESFERMNAAIGAAQLRPVVGQTFAFEEAREAFGFMQRGEHFGKVCISLG